MKATQYNGNNPEITKEYRELLEKVLNADKKKGEKGLVILSFRWPNPDEEGKEISEYASIVNGCDNIDLIKTILSFAASSVEEDTTAFLRCVLKASILRDKGVIECDTDGKNFFVQAGDDA